LWSIEPAKIILYGLALVIGKKMVDLREPQTAMSKLRYENMVKQQQFEKMTNRVFLLSTLKKVALQFSYEYMIHIIWIHIGIKFHTRWIDICGASK